MLVAHRSCSLIAHSEIVGFAHNRVHSAIANRPLAIHPVLQGIGCAPHAKCAGEQNRRLNLTQFPDLGRTHQFAIAIADVDPCRQRFLKQVSRRRYDGGNTGANIVAFNDGRVTDLNAVDIGDCIQRPGRENADRQTNVACAWALKFF